MSAQVGDGNKMANGDEEILVEPRVLGLYHVNINVSSLERSRRFYELFGFRVVDRFNEKNNANLDRGLGLPPEMGSENHALFMMVGDSRHATVLDMCEWIHPRSEARNAPPAVNDLGIPRICLRVKHLDHLILQLKEKGVAFVTDEPQCLHTLDRQPRFILCRDPDGIMVELVEL
ncbi:VOC family protein [Sinimarinibacterium flocculans]|uniref:VOC family protein n=1 Tax=Sinimarinibacterium flocculans TaxID=985250 RepID=UPI0024911E38|nr:VOC family protein [Sinimarinibacterium flocculans]